MISYTESTKAPTLSVRKKRIIHYTRPHDTRADYQPAMVKRRVVAEVLAQLRRRELEFVLRRHASRSHHVSPIGPAVKVALVKLT